MSRKIGRPSWITATCKCKIIRARTTWMRKIWSAFHNPLMFFLSNKSKTAPTETLSMIGQLTLGMTCSRLWSKHPNHNNTLGFLRVLAQKSEGKESTANLERNKKWKWIYNMILLGGINKICLPESRIIVASRHLQSQTQDWSRSNNSSHDLNRIFRFHSRLSRPLIRGLPKSPNKEIKI
jgi:hypothetical protein